MAIWKSTWKAINREYGYPGHFGWDWPTLRITYPQRAAVLKRCAEVMNPGFKAIGRYL